METPKQASPSTTTCEVCEGMTAKYRCPRCSRRTCSVECCRRHKDESGCDGRRDRTNFVRVSEFTEQQLRSDFHFLEDGLRSIEGARRERLELCGPSRSKKRKFGERGARAAAAAATTASAGPLPPASDNDWLSQQPPGMQRLVREAMLRGTTLLLMA
ncbi:unnamed protein product, partial [Phaeothamnion confervicola]